MKKGTKGKKLSIFENEKCECGTFFYRSYYKKVENKVCAFCSKCGRNVTERLEKKR
jgi:hypothetical protein